MIRENRYEQGFLYFLFCSLWMYFCVYVCMYAKLLQACLTVYDPMDCSPPDSLVCGISQARILEWVAFLFSKGSFQPRD